MTSRQGRRIPAALEARAVELLRSKMSVADVAVEVDLSERMVYLIRKRNDCRLPSEIARSQAAQARIEARRRRSERDARVAELTAAGWTLAKIAAELGIATRTVQKIRSEMGIIAVQPHVQLTTKHRRRIVEMSLAGEKVADIAAELGLNQRTVSRVRVTEGVADMRNVMSRPMTADEIERARAMIEDGASCSEVARTLGRHPTTIASKFRGQGWTREQSSEHASMLRRHRDALR